MLLCLVQSACKRIWKRMSSSYASSFLHSRILTQPCSLSESFKYFHIQSSLSNVIPRICGRHAILDISDLSYEATIEKSVYPNWPITFTMLKFILEITVIIIVCIVIFAVVVSTYCICLSYFQLSHSSSIWNMWIWTKTLRMENHGAHAHLRPAACGNIGDLKFSMLHRGMAVWRNFLGSTRRPSTSTEK